jgi:ADP-ribosyl-[dinitrogen reductase] hydrolase
MDKFQGAVFGAALGDSSGLPYEFMQDGESFKYEYGLKDYKRYYPQWNVYSRWLKGSVTDDTEMMMSLMNSVLTKERYDRDAVVQGYADWAETTNMKGRNTRWLFNGDVKKNIKWNKSEYEAKIAQKSNVQSNGCLMRCVPLVLLDCECWDTDCRITNNNDVSVEINKIYLSILHKIVCLEDVDVKFDIMGLSSNNADIQTCLEQVQKKLPRKIANESKPHNKGDLRECRQKIIDTCKKGWALHGLYCALYGYMYINSFKELMEFVIRENSDTDTNACIAGAMYGAKIGFAALERECPDLKWILNNNAAFNSRKRKLIYQPGSLYRLSHEYYTLLKQ